MKHENLVVPASLIVVLGAVATACTGGNAERRTLRLAGDDCGHADTVCLETDPPQCFDVCLDDDGDVGDGDCTVSSEDEVVVCGGDDCVVGIDADGVETVVCPPFGDDCSVEIDDRGNESFVCDGSEGDDDGEGGDGGDGAGAACDAETPCSGELTCAVVGDDPDPRCVAPADACAELACAGECLLLESYPVQIRCAD